MIQRYTLFPLLSALLYSSISLIYLSSIYTSVSHLSLSSTYSLIPSVIEVTAASANKNKNDEDGEEDTWKPARSSDPNIVCCQGKRGRWRQLPEPLPSDPKPHPPYDDLHTKPDATIVVLIAALKETRLANTIRSFLTNATYPERVHFAIVQQNDPKDNDIVYEYCKLIGKPIEIIKDTRATEPVDRDRVVEISNPNNCPGVDRIRVLRLRTDEAKGPAYARARGNELVKQHDDFCMQIDAHTVVAKGWDVFLMSEWGRTENEYAVLSTYPTNFKDLMQNTGRHWEMPHLCCANFYGTGIVSNCQAKAAANLDRPLLAPLWAAGLSFSKCHAERVVPNDVNFKHIFSGEEFGRGARLWTYGYDFYSITRPYVGTYYGSDKGGGEGWRSNSAESRESVRYIQTLLESPGSDQSPEARKKLIGHELGTRRSLTQYIEFSGVDTRKNKSVPGGERCIIKYVPWDDSGLRRRIKYGGRVEDGEMSEEEEKALLESRKQEQAEHEEEQKVRREIEIEVHANSIHQDQIEQTINQASSNNGNDEQSAKSSGFFTYIFIALILVCGYGFNKIRSSPALWRRLKLCFNCQTSKAYKRSVVQREIL